MKPAIDLLARTAARDPERIAFLFEDETMSFRELDAAVDRQVERLLDLGLERGDTVAVHAGNSLCWVELFFASARAGTVLVPIDHRLDAEEVLQIVTSATTRWLYYDDGTARSVNRLAETLDSAGVERLHLHDRAVFSRDSTRRKGARQPLAPPMETDLFALTYTSGAGATAKGVLLTHANLVVGTHEFSQENLRYRSGDVFFNSASLSHRAGWARLVQSVGVGATQLLTRTFEAGTALRLIREHEVTVIGFVATLFRMLTEEAERHSASLPGDFLGGLPSVRTVIATGEPCSATLRTSIHKLFPNAELITTYASTEAGIVAALQPAEHDSHTGSVGRPIPGVELRILDPEDANELPTDEIGEIAVRSGVRGSAGVMLGYRGDDPDDSFSDDWYLSGDLGRIDTEGYLYITGRKRDMIRTGGLKVSAEEVERCLELHPGVHEAAVVAAPDPKWWEAVVAFVAPADNWEADEQELIAFCKERMASYKKPRDVFFVDKLPRTSSGKVWKHQLKQRLEANQESKSGNKSGTEP